ncbi:MAG TPA: dienelactone hydrolase family protein [Gemmataceae bacterium]|nr:dienelactone hydrolase family protein [Gemmataceae bacterium]
MTALKLVVVTLAAVLWLGFARPAKAKEHGFVERVHKNADGKEAKYVLFVPQGYTGAKPYPLLLFLHGAGEREGGKKAPVDVGIGPAIKKLGEEQFQFFVIIPRCEANPHNWQADGPDAQRALAMLGEVQKDYKIDAKRIYLTGLSMGGFGTWSLAAKYPDRWAAIVPICGGGNPMQAEKIKDIPCWCFHGQADPTVNVERSRSMVEALKKAGGHPEYTEYPGVGHNSWDKAYATPELYTWLLEQHRP